MVVEYCTWLRRSAGLSVLDEGRRSMWAFVGAVGAVAALECISLAFLVCRYVGVNGTDRVSWLAMIHVDYSAIGIVHG